MSQISFNLFYLWDKRLLSEFLRKWGWFHGHNERFPKYLGWKLNFKKFETGFVDERAMATMTLISSCPWNTPVPFAGKRKDLKTHL